MTTDAPSSGPPFPSLFPDRLTAQHLIMVPVVVLSTPRLGGVHDPGGVVEVRSIGAPKGAQSALDWADLVGAYSPVPSAGYSAMAAMATLPPGCTMERVSSLGRGQHVLWLNVRQHGGTTARRYHGKVVSVTTHEGVATVELADAAGVSGRVTVMADDTVIVGPK